MVWASHGEGVFETEKILPRSRTEVLFAMGDRHWLRDPEDARRDRAYETSFVSGLHQRPLHVVQPTDRAMAGVRLRPTGTAAFLRDTPAAIAGSVVDLGDVLDGTVERLREAKLSDEQLRAANKAKVFGGSFALAFVAAWVFAMFLGPEPAPGFAVGVGALAGLCWVGASFGINDLFEQRSLKLWAINAGYHTLVFTLFGAVFGLWH